MKQYRGKLTLSDIATGYNLAMRNAKRLAEDAKFLFEDERYLSSITIGTSAIEEHGK